MDYSVKMLLSEYSSVLEGYSGLLMVRLMNLCVKSNPVALIPVVIEHPRGDMPIEEVADASVPDEEHIDVFPKVEDDIFIIGKGILEAHPEFQMSQETMKSGDDEMQYLRFTMPKVDKNRRDVLLQAVDLFHEECKKQLLETKGKYQPQLADKLPNLSKEEADKAQDEFDNIYKANTDSAKETVEDKKKEIEEAYQRYLEKKKASEQAAQEQQAAEGEDVKSQLKMPTE